MGRCKLLTRAGVLGWMLALLVPLWAQGTRDTKGEFSTLLHRGFELHQHADYVNAAALLRRAWKLNPHNYFVNLLLGVEMLRTGDPDEAVGFLKEASRQRSNEDVPYGYMGEAQAAMGHHAEAAEAYLHAMQLSPLSQEAIQGWVDYSLERFRELAGRLRSSDRGLAAAYRLQAISLPLADVKRRELLEHAATLDPKAPGIWGELAMAHFASGNPTAAQSDLSRAGAENALDLRYSEVAALLSAKAGEWVAAAEHLNQIASQSPGALARVVSDWPAALQPNDGSLVNGPAAKFLECARDAQENCTPDELSHQSSIGVRRASGSREILYREQRWDRLSALPAPGTNDSDLWLQWGESFAQLGKWPQAIPALERGVRNQSDKVYAEFLLSSCYASEAGRAVARLQRIGAGEAVAHTVRGDVMLRMQGNSAAAIAEYKLALASQSDDPRLLERMAEALVSDGQFDAAADYAHAALRIDPYRFSATRTLAQVAMRQRMYVEALPYLEQLATHDPKDLTTQVDLATALEQMGNFVEALKHLEPALQQNFPDEKGSLHSLLGTALRRVGRSQDAATAFATARRLSDEYQMSTHREEATQKTGSPP